MSLFAFLVRHSPMFALLLIVSATPSVPVVTITGGADDTGQTYVWTVTHDHTSPIVRVEFPHYRGGWSIPPEGWTSEITNRGGAAGRSGQFIAVAGDPSCAIARGHRAEFQLVITPDGTPRGQGRVTVRFSDGSEVHVPAEIPIKEPAADRNMTLIGLGLIFAIFLLYRALKRKRHAATSSPDRS